MKYVDTYAQDSISHICKRRTWLNRKTRCFLEIKSEGQRIVRSSYLISENKNRNMKSKIVLILMNVGVYSHFHPSGRRIYIYVGTYAVAFLFSRQRFPKFPLDRGERIETSERSHFFYLLIFIHGCLKPSSFPSGSARPPFSLFHSLKSLVPLPYRRVLLHSTLYTFSHVPASTSLRSPLPTASFHSH